MVGVKFKPTKQKIIVSEEWVGGQTCHPPGKENVMLFYSTLKMVSKIVPGKT